MNISESSFWDMDIIFAAVGIDLALKLNEFVIVKAKYCPYLLASLIVFIVEIIVMSGIIWREHPF